ncbi:MAG TPA: DUF3592 domain-containing protein [Chitinophagaceae bacterium]|nr:DUF3592 domain-containing protein [Chitinophagaceae bacterium]
MIFIYIGMILLAALPATMVIWRMRKAIHIKKNGIATDAYVTSIITQRLSKTTFDIVHMEFRDRATGKTYTSKATTTVGKHKRGDRMTIYYLPNDPSKNSPIGGKMYIPMLIFCIILFLFVLFAVYKIDEEVKGVNIG